MRAPRRAWIALGSNLGDRLGELASALDALCAGGLAIDEVSSVFETEPWGVEDQPRFANAAASGRTSLTPHALLALCKRIEVAAGRNLNAPRNTARPIDIDILLLEDEVVAAPDLIVPHASMHQRAFVLVPLAELAAEQWHPLLGASIATLLADVPETDRGSMELLAVSGWWSPRGTR